MAVVYLRRVFIVVGGVRVRGFTGWGDGVAHGLEVVHVVDLLRLFFGRAADQFDRGDDVAGVFLGQERVDADQRQADRKSVGSGKSVSVRVDPGGRRIIKKKTNENTYKQHIESNTKNKE